MTPASRIKALALGVVGRAGPVHIARIGWRKWLPMALPRPSSTCWMKRSRSMAWVMARRTRVVSGLRRLFSASVPLPLGPDQHSKPCRPKRSTVCVAMLKTRRRRHGRRLGSRLIDEAKLHRIRRTWLRFGSLHISRGDAAARSSARSGRGPCPRVAACSAVAGWSTTQCSRQTEQGIGVGMVQSQHHGVASGVSMAAMVKPGLLCLVGRRGAMARQEKRTVDASNGAPS